MPETHRMGALHNGGARSASEIIVRTEIAAREAQRPGRKTAAPRGGGSSSTFGAAPVLSAGARITAT